MDDRVSASVRGSKGLPLFPIVVESLKTRGRIVPLLDCIPGCHQCGLNQRRGQGEKTSILCQSSTSQCRGEVPTDGEAHFALVTAAHKHKPYFQVY